MTPAPAPWIHGTEPVRRLWALGAALTLTAVGIDQIFGGQLSLFFDVCFIAICALLAWRVQHGGFYAAAWMPPGLLFGTVLFLAMTSPAMVADEGDGTIQALVSGLAHHSVGLAGGFAVAVAVLQWRGRNERGDVDG